jgi:hypothetical protein
MRVKRTDTIGVARDDTDRRPARGLRLSVQSRTTKRSKGINSNGNIDEAGRRGKPYGKANRKETTKWNRPTERN